MRILSIAVGTPREVPWAGRIVQTSIFKTPVDGPVMVRAQNIEGDRQSDRKVHGGEFKAIYAYAAEDYDFWREKLGRELEPANFGENLLIENFNAARICIGDRFTAGGAELEAAQPRLPCYKLGVRFGDARMVKEFAAAGRWGVYFRVIREGLLQASDTLLLMQNDPEKIPVYDVARVFVRDREDLAMMRRLAAHPRLDPAWREWYRGKQNGNC